MKRTAIALMLVSTALSASASLSVHATAEPPVALPGIPIRLILTVENKSDKAQTVPQRMVVQVRPESGDSFIPDVLGSPVKMFPAEYRDSRTVMPGQRRLYEVALSTALTDGAMADPRLWNPGSYQVQLLMHDDLREFDIQRFGLDGLLGAGRIRTPLLKSSETTLRIEKPSGVDAEIWDTILQKTEGRGLLRTKEHDADRIVNALWPRSADSPYRPYLIDYMKYTPREELRPRWKEVVERDPNHPVAEVIRLGRAHAKARDAENSILQGADLQTILRLTDQARAELIALEKEARQDVVRIRARDALGKIKSEERLVEMYRELAPKR